ncbi:transposase [Streptomyces sp. NPDC060198]|uniref:transposase n=1 Tax=Streptomyces sp. NPDC060198 TaxID=3347070 RepID=UPI00365BE2BB
MGTRPWIVDDGLWALVELMLPERPSGPRPVSDRLCLQGILFVLHDDTAWQLLPLELGFGSGQTWRHRLAPGQRAGVFDRLHRVLLAELNAAGEPDWSHACMDGSHHPRERGHRHRSVTGRPAEERQQVPPDLRRTRSRRQLRHPAALSERPAESSMRMLLRPAVHRT